MPNKGSIIHGERKNMSINLIKTGENIRKLAEKRGLSPTQLVEEIVGISSVQAVYKWYKGINLPTVDNLIELQRAFGLDSINQILVCDDAEENEIACVRKLG